MWVKVCTILSLILAILIGLIFSGFAKDIGLFRLLASADPRLPGLLPVFYDGPRDKYTAQNLPDLSGKVALVTGANNGHYGLRPF